MKTKKRKIIKNGKNKRTQKAGIRLDQNISHEKAFKFFIENSSFSYFNRGYFGILILAKLKDGIESPYRHIRTNGIKKVKHLLLKFFEIKPLSNNPDIKHIDFSDIQREINIQQTIYISSLRNPDTLLEPICPCIVYSHAETLNKSFKESFYKIISQSIKGNKQIDKLFQYDVAFFAMEFMENYLPLSNYTNTETSTTNPLYTSSTTNALYTLDKLHTLGFMHNDFHDNNVLLVRNYNYFGFEKDIMGRAIIIDFGLTNKFKPPEKIDDKYKLKLLQKESDYAHFGLLYNFKWLDEEHKKVQDKYIAIFEKYYKCDINRIITSFKIYIGGNNMSIPNSKFKPIFHNHVYNYNKQNNINNNTLADQAEEELKQTNPEKYDEIINSIKETLEEEKQNPGYIKALFANQMNGLIDPAFILPVNITNKSNNLTLIMD
jgi:tRNA A-37 threonylcarbamoyl transferase component Bud32